jgi:dolichol-phosphate mannosyltransferase
VKYSFVVPIYNDAALADDLCREVATTFRDYLGHADLARDIEVIFVDDGSANDSVQVLKETCRTFPFAKVIALSRNFGQHVAISAGYRAAAGDYVGMLNVDQEDPPRELPKLLDAIQGSDYDIIGGLYERRSVPFFSAVTSRLFHITLNLLTGYATPSNSSTMRIMTRRAVESYNALTEKNRYIPGLEGWLGLRYGRVRVEHQKRKVGKSSYNFGRRLGMAIASVISFSDFPLRLAVKAGLLMAAVGVLLALAVVADMLFVRPHLPGYTSTISVIAVFSGVQLTVTGIASLYIGRILGEVQRRPLFIVRETYRGERAFDGPKS